MASFEGDKNLNQEIATCWNKLTDPAFLLQCIPNVESVMQSEPDQLRFKLRPGVSFVRGTLETTVKIDKIEPAKSARYLVLSRGMASSSEVEATLTLAPMHEGTHLHWVVVIKALGGLMKAIPHGLVQASAQKVVGDILATVESKLNAMPPNSSGD
jgi:carbon monoxide dehydrogenase subunit G